MGRRKSVRRKKKRRRRDHKSVADIQSHTGREMGRVQGTKLRGKYGI